MGQRPPQGGGFAEILKKLMSELGGGDKWRGGGMGDMLAKLMSGMGEAFSEKFRTCLA